MVYFMNDHLQIQKLGNELSRWDRVLRFVWWGSYENSSIYMDVCIDVSVIVLKLKTLKHVKTIF